MRQGGVAQRVRAGHIYEVGQLSVGNRMRRCEAASLVHGNVDDHRAGLHELEILSPDQARRACITNQDRAYDQVGLRKLI